MGAVTHKVSEIAGYWTLNETITAPTTDVNETFNWFYCTNSPIIENIPANTTVEMNIQLSTDIIQAGAYMYFTFAGALWGNKDIAATGDVVITSGLSQDVNAVLASAGTITLSGYND